VVVMLWRSWWWFWFNFQKIFESLKEIWWGMYAWCKFWGCWLVSYAPSNGMHRGIRWVWFGEINNIANLEEFIWC
jgi:hypothetical protein